MTPDARSDVLPEPTNFEQLFREEYPVLVRISYAIVRDTHLAQDVAQDVLIAAQRRFSEPYDTDHVKGWVKVATTHASLNQVRASRRRHEHQTRTPHVVGSVGPEEAALAGEQEGEVRAVLARLPRHAATVLVLRHSGLSYAEIAQSMGVRIGHVGTMLRRAEAKFRKEVQRATPS